MSETPATPEPPAGATDPVQLTRSMARQVILDAQGQIFGYELHDPSVQPDEQTAAGDAQLLFGVLTLAEDNTLASRKTLFVRCAHDSLASGHLELVAPEHVVLDIAPLPLSQIDQIQNRLPALQQAHQRGFALAFDYSVLTRPYENWLPLASFIRFDLSLMKPDGLATFVRLARQKSPAQLIACGVQTRAQQELAGQLGIGLLQGNWFAEPVIVAGRSIRPGQATVLQLLNLVRKQASTNAIEELLKHDPALSFNLLRFINSAGFGLRTEVTSFRHAVMLLGLKRLFKWSALLLTTSADARTPAAVGSTAVVRGRLMELLALESMSPEECDHAFVAGVFSLLDAMLGLPLAQALDNVALPAEVTDALLHRRGPLAPYLTLAQACETGDELAFANAASQLKLSSSQINWAHLQALTWAENLSVR